MKREREGRERGREKERETVEGKRYCLIEANLNSGKSLLNNNANCNSEIATTETETMKKTDSELVIINK